MTPVTVFRQEDLRFLVMWGIEERLIELGMERRGIQGDLRAFSSA